MLTNGAEWRVYNAHAPVPIEQKLFRTVRIDEDLDSANSVLELLSKDNMREMRIEELWKGFFIDRKVHSALTQLFRPGEPAKEIVSAVRHRAEDLKLPEVRESLARVRAVFDFPVELLPGPLPAAVSSKPLASTPPVAAKHVQEAEGTISLKALLDSGRLAPTTIEATYLGQHHTAEILPDGRVRYSGAIYGSLSGAGSAMRIAVKQPEESSSWSPSTDGWSFWHALDEKTGKLVALKVIRRRAAQSP